VKKTLALIAKLTITVALLYFSVSRASLGLIAQRAQQLNFGWLFAAVAILSLQTVVSALRWRRIVSACGAAISISQAGRYTFISVFFSQVLPSTIGGDAARIWLVARDGMAWSKAIYSVIVDRVAGVLALALFVVLGIPASFAMIHDPLARAALLLLGFASVLAPALFVGMGVRQWALLKRFSVTRHVNAVASAAYRIFMSPRSGAWVLGLSFIIQILTITGAWLAAKSIAAPFDFIDAFLLIPPVLLIATIPISIAGWGVREGAMVMAFSYSGLPQADGLLVSALFGIAIFLVGVIGGLLWLVGGRREIVPGADGWA
jgi:glycosyltransferase 2 family protein